MPTAPAVSLITAATGALKVENQGRTYLDQYIYAADRGMKPEKVDAWELGYLGNWQDWRASLDARLFYEKDS